MPQRSPSFWYSLTYAWAGVCYAVRHQRNVRIHLAFVGLVLLLAVGLQIDRTGQAMLAFAMGLVLTTELLNTALEALVDLVEPEPHALAKVAKDVAAGAVLISAVTAIVIGLLVLGPPLWRYVVNLLTI